MFEKIAIFIAWHLPRRLAYWSAIRVIANATQGEHSNQVVPDLLAMDALQCWQPRSIS